LLAMSVSTAERFLRTQRKPRLQGLSTTTPVARLSARRLPRGAERGHDGAQPRHPLALAGHGTVRLRVVRLTSR
jgi:hypothetical protein